MTAKQRKAIQKQLDALGHAVAVLPEGARGELLVPWKLADDLDGLDGLRQLKVPPNVKVMCSCGLPEKNETIVRRVFVG